MPPGGELGGSDGNEEGAREEGAREEGAREEGAREEDSGEEGAGEEDSGEEGAGEEDSGEEGAGEEDSGEEGAGEEDSGEEGARQQGTADRQRGRSLGDGSDGGQEAITDSLIRAQVPEPIDWVAEGWRQYEYFSGKVSDVTRQMVLLGLASVVFIGGLTSDDFAAGQAVDLDDALIWSGVLLATSLILDLCHYGIGSLVWFGWPRYHEHREARPNYVRPQKFPGWIPRVINLFLAVKLLAALTGWILLLSLLARSVK